MKRYTRPILIIILSLLLLYFGRGKENAPRSLPLPTSTSYQSRDGWYGPSWYPVARVVDGDTLDIFHDGERVRIRLIGVDTPEIVDERRPIQCFGKEASEKAKELLLGKTVRVETDSSQGMYDKYGRLLAYVYLPDETMFNKQMIALGYGHEYTFDVPYKYQKEFKDAEARAHTSGLGLWASSACMPTR